MIYPIARRIAAGLLNNKQDCSEEETVAYGLFVLLSDILYFAISIIAGFCFGCIKECVIFYFSFQFIKKYSGGYHAKTEIHCFIISTASVITSAVLIYSAKLHKVIMLLVFLFTLLLSVSILLFSPLENEEKPLTGDIKKKYHVKAILRTLLLLATAIILYFCGRHNYSVAVSVGLLLAGALQSTGVLMQNSKQKTD